MSASHLPAAILASITGTAAASDPQDLLNADASPFPRRDGPTTSSVTPTGSASPPAGSAGFQRERRLREYQEREQQARTVLQQRLQESRTYHGITVTGPSTAASPPVSGVPALLEVIRQERAQSALPPLTEMTRVAIASCPAVFELLARGEPLEPLVRSGTLVPSTWCSSEDDRPAGRQRRSLSTSSAQHIISFYVREWRPAAGVDVTTVMNSFAQAFPIHKEFVSGTTSLVQMIRYIGLCVDGEPRMRVAEDAGSASNAGPKSRLLNFMASQAPPEQWAAYHIPGLDIQSPAPTEMPLTAFLANFPDATRNLPSLPLAITRTMILKHVNLLASSIESSLIHCCRRGSICMNSASYGGLDTLPPLAIPPQLNNLRAEVRRACGGAPFAPLPHMQVDPTLFAEMLRLFTSAAAALEIEVSQHVLTANAIYAAIPSRWLHMLKDVTQEDLKGEGTRFGRYGGPGLSSSANALSWALGDPSAASAGARAREDLKHLKIIGASVDFWWMSRTQKMEYVPTLLNLMVNVLSARRRSGVLDTIVIHSAQVFELIIVQQGLADGSPLCTEAPDRLSYTRNYLEHVGTMHEARVGAEDIPAVALFDAGYVKYDGDEVLRADLHSLAHVSNMMLRLLDWQASIGMAEGLSAEEIIERTKMAARQIGLEAALLTVRSRVTTYVWAHKSLQALPSLLQHAQAAPEAFEAREASYQRRGDGLTRARESKGAVVAEADREAQINTLLAAAATTAGVTTDISTISGSILLASLPVPASIKDIGAAGSVEEWKAWMRKRKTGSNVTRAAYATYAIKGEHKRPNRHKRDLVGLRIRKLEKGLDKFWKQITLQKARETVASGRQTRFGDNEPTTLYRCRRCAYTAILNANITSFLHLCWEEEVVNDAHDERFRKRRVDSSEHVDRLAAEHGLR